MISYPRPRINVMLRLRLLYLYFNKTRNVIPIDIDISGFCDTFTYPRASKATYMVFRGLGCPG
jgi:hypothetical protein